MTFYLVLFGYETDKFDTILENKITKNLANTKINIDKIKVKIDVKNISFFVTTAKPVIKYHNNKINIAKIDAYINLKSLIIAKPKINNLNIVSNEIDVNEIKNIIKYTKPSNFKKFFLNEVEKGVIAFNLDINLKNNLINNYEINGYVKNFFAGIQDVKLEKSSFIYQVKKNSSEIDNLRGFVNGFQINSGNLEFNYSELLDIKGNLNSDLNLSKKNVKKLFKNNLLQDFENLNFSGKIKNTFNIQLDETLKVLNYQIEASGNIKKSQIKFKKPKQYLFVKNKIKKFNLEKTDFNFNFGEKVKNTIDINGFYVLNDNTPQKFDFKNLRALNSQKFLIDIDFANEINIPIFNFSTMNKIVNIKTEFETKKDTINFKKFNLIQEKNKIYISNLFLKNKKLIKFENISVKTFNKNTINNDFKASFGKTINVKGLKYDATNLTKLLDQNNDNFLDNINKEVSVNIKEISTKVSDKISNFNLIGYIQRGKFNKIVSKGEFKDDKYLDISLKVDEKKNKKILEVYSDLPKPLLSNYKFFDGLSGGQLLILSSYDDKVSNTKLTIENFKVKDAPGLVKLLSLADFGGMVDAVSGEGLSFEKLEMSLEKNDQVLNLMELYAIGPSISILMEGYVDNKSGLVSLRGTMVPAKTLNKFLSKLPIVGDIIIPKEIGEGLFGISFKMKGMPGRIKTSVNPIKTLTPRFIQKALKKAK